jgi:hypothetical protein
MSLIKKALHEVPDGGVRRAKIGVLHQHYFT